MRDLRGMVAAGLLGVGSGEGVRVPRLRFLAGLAVAATGVSKKNWSCKTKHTGPEGAPTPLAAIVAVCARTAKHALHHLAGGEGTCAAVARQTGSRGSGAHHLGHTSLPVLVAGWQQVSKKNTGLL